MNNIKTQEKINFWKSNVKDSELLDLLNNMNEKELEESFSGDLTFGTAGIRGKIGPGTNRMNIYNIIKNTYGYAKFLKNKYKGDILIVIGTDNRHKRKEFSQVAAETLSSFGIRTVKTLIIPTPLVSFAIRELKAQGGIIITASHNPADNNGYKVYDDEGCQLLPDDAEQIAEYTKEKEEFITWEYIADKKLISEIPEKVFTKYEELIKGIDKRGGEKNLKITFSPQHGTSAKFLPQYLKDIGYDVFNVEEQMSHDPDFKGTPSPNPEDERAYELGIEYSVKNNSDIFITTDPDADRIGVAAIKDGKFEILNGNQLAPIIFEYLLNNRDIKNSYMVYSYVSTHICKLMAEQNGVESIEVATGFKWIGNIIKNKKDKKFLFAFEESYGCLIDSSIARDKDSLQAAVLVSEIANEAKKENKTLWDLLEDIHKKYKYFSTKTKTKEFKGLDAIKSRLDFMANIRSNAKTLFEDKYEVVDLLNGKDKIAPMNLIRFSFECGSWIAARPSGTEPKIKFYKVAVANSNIELDEKNKKLNKYINILTGER